MLPAIFQCLIAWALLLPQSASAQIADASAYLKRAEAQHLAEQHQWQRLLHHKPGARQSEITSADFFLAPDGRKSSKAELAATIHALLLPVGADINAHARCRYPARYEWLHTQLQLPSAVEHCPAFEDWAKSESLRSVSLMLVSGYLGNPASSFGHSLLRFNHEEDSAGGRLIDLSFNFGARVPDGEPMLRYIFKGNLGGYQSGFSSGAYFLQDQVYARTEFRDVWEYQLSLTPAENLRLAAHLWELSNQTFDYYFLTKNCAYRLAELLTLATEQSYTPSARVWFTPVELFHALVADTGRQPPLVTEVRYVPSTQRLFYAQFERLDAHEAALANQLIADGPAALDRVLTPLPVARQLELIDTLLAYYEYRLAAQHEQPPPAALVANKDRLLRARFALPPRESPVPEPAPLPAPTTGAHGMLLAAGVIHDGQGNALQLHFAPYLQDLIGRHRSGFVELAVLDSEARWLGGHLMLDRLDVVRVRKLAVTPDIVGESQWSWQAHGGLRRERLAPQAGVQDELHLQFGGGLGRAAALSPSMLAYASLDGTIEAGASPVHAGPSLGLVMRGDGLRARAELRGEYDLRRERWQPRAEAELGLPLARDFELRGGLRYDDVTSLSLSLYSTW